MRGFLLKILEDGKEKTLKINNPFLIAGNDYKSSILIGQLKSSFVLAENKLNSIRINLNEGFRIKVHYDKKVFDIDEIKGIFPKQNYLELNKNVVCEIEIDNKKILFKAIDIKEEKLTSINKFKKSYVSRENLSFFMLFLMLSFVMLSFFTYASLKAKPLPKLAKVEEREKEIEIEYKEVGLKSSDTRQDKKIDKREVTKDMAKAGIDVVKKAENVTDTAVKKGESFFEGQAIVKEGILGVKDGAKNIVIQREKSLFSKIDETLESIPVKGTGEVSEKARKLDETDSGRFESVKAESIYKGPEKKEVKTELSAGTTIKAEVQKEQDIRILKGKRPENEILSVIGRYKKGFEFIFIDARKRDPKLEGKVVVFFVISEEGNVTKAEIVESSIKNQEFLDRLLTLVRSIKFPKSDTGDTGVKIPFLFFPQG